MALSDLNPFQVARNLKAGSLYREEVGSRVGGVSSKSIETAATQKAEKLAERELEHLAAGGYPGKIGSFAGKAVKAPAKFMGKMGKTALIVGGVAGGAALLANYVGGRAQKGREDARYDAEMDAFASEGAEMENQMQVLSAEESMAQGNPNTMMGMEPQPGEFANRVRGGAQDPAMQPEMSAANFEKADDHVSLANKSGNPGDPNFGLSA